MSKIHRLSISEGNDSVLRRFQFMEQRWLGACLALVLCWLVVASQPLGAQAPASVQQLQQQQQQLDQQKTQVSQEKNRLKILEQEAQGGLQGVQRTLVTTGKQIKASDTQLQKATATLNQLEQKLTQSEVQYRNQQDATVARLRYLQRQSPSWGWATLLQSQTLTDFLDRRYRLGRIYHADRQSLMALTDQTQRLNQQRDQVEQKKIEVTLLKQQLLAQKQDMEAQAALQKESIDRLKSDRRALEQAEMQLEEDSRAISSLIHQQVALRSNQVYLQGTGQMMLPLLAEITSSFGWRTHPILGYQKFHAGMDFGADYGSMIRAADSGLVLYAGWYGGYGNAVIIDHGNGLTTLYGHSSEVYVAEGQTVQRGQPIAAVGSTGLSTGPHLHFEVRRDGEPVDPAQYL